MFVATALADVAGEKAGGGFKCTADDTEAAGAFMFSVLRVRLVSADDGRSVGECFDVLLLLLLLVDVDGAWAGER